MSDEFVSDAADAYDAFGLNDIDDTPTTNSFDHGDEEDVFGAAAGEYADEHADAEPVDVESFGFDTPMMTESELAADEPSNEVYSKWEAEHEKKLKAKAERIRAEKKQAIEDAKKDIENFYSKRNTTIAQTQADNKTTEENAKKSAKETTEKGSQWEKVTRYCDLKPRPEGKGGQQKKNEKMRTVLVDLKASEKK